MKILGIETSCDETGVAIVEKKDNHFTVLANVVATSLTLHAQTGGIIPETAAREQLKFMMPTLKKALKDGIDFTVTTKEVPEIDAIAVTYGPGLIGSLLVGVETAKTLSLLWNKPLIPVNHMYGHLYANWLEKSDIRLPAIILVVSGNHTDLLLMQSQQTIRVLGGTRDDAAGEAFDKIGRLLGLTYPAGAMISRLAKNGNPQTYPLPRPMIGSLNYDFSFSGLKTAVLNLVRKNNWDFSDPVFAEKNQSLLVDLCASVEQAIIDVLVHKTIKAAKEHNINSILLGGGVAANGKLKQTLLMELQSHFANKATLFVPSPQFCTDNGAMIAAAGFFATSKPWQEIDANPELYY